MERTTRGLATVGWSRDGTQLFAAGDARDRSHQSSVLSWPTADLGPRPGGPRGFIDAGLEDVIGSIIPLADKSIVATSLSGDIVLSGADGVRRASVTSAVAADFRVSGVFAGLEYAEPLLVSDDGKRVAWSQWLSGGRWDIADAGAGAGGFGLSSANRKPEGLTEPLTGTFNNYVEPWRWGDVQPQLFLKGAGSSRQLAIDPHERAISAAVRDDFVLLGTEYMLRLFDGAGNPIWQHHIPARALRVNQAPGGQVEVAALGDGTVRWYRLRDGQELLALFLTRDAKRWVAFTPSGYYDASPGGEDLIGWHVNRGKDQAADFFPASRFADTMHRPDVIKQVLATLDEGEAVKLANAAAGRNDARMTPELIVSLAPPVLEAVSVPERFASDSITIQYRVRGAQMVGKPRVKVNGAWQPRSRAADQVAQDGTRDLVISHLPPRDSVVEIYADGHHGTSVPLAFSLKWDERAALSPGQQGP